jgi:hypothetical protein
MKSPDFACWNCEWKFSVTVYGGPHEPYLSGAFTPPPSDILYCPHCGSICLVDTPTEMHWRGLTTDRHEAPLDEKP